MFPHRTYSHLVGARHHKVGVAGGHQVRCDAAAEVILVLICLPAGGEGPRCREVLTYCSSPPRLPAHRQSTSASSYLVSPAHARCCIASATPPPCSPVDVSIFVLGLLQRVRDVALRDPHLLAQKSGHQVSITAVQQYINMSAVRQSDPHTMQPAVLRNNVARGVIQAVNLFFAYSIPLHHLTCITVTYVTSNII